MRMVAMILLVGCCSAYPAVAQERRELGPHQHGHGTLNIAIEGARVSMELDVPGADIVGFEHAATTKAQLAAMDKAKAQLAAPLALFVFPAAAGCSVKEANVKIEGSEGSKGDQKSAEVASGDKAHGKDDPAQQHSDFNADYALECTSIGALTSIEFPYFRMFSGAEELEVNVITPKGQSKFEVKRNKPRIDLTGMM